MDGKEFSLRPRAQVVDRMGGELLACAALTLDQHRGAGGGDLFDRFKNLHHRGRAADHALDRILPLDLGAEFLVFADGVSLADGPFDQDFQTVDIHRLGDKIIHTAPHRLHGGIHRSVGGHHDANRRVRAGGDDFDQLHSVARAEAQIGE